MDYAITPDPDLPGDSNMETRNISLSTLFRYAPESYCCNMPESPQTPMGCVFSGPSGPCLMPPENARSNYIGRFDVTLITLYFDFLNII